MLGLQNSFALLGVANKQGDSFVNHCDFRIQTSAMDGQMQCDTRQGWRIHCDLRDGRMHCDIS